MLFYLASCLSFTTSLGGLQRLSCRLCERTAFERQAFWLWWPASFNYIPNASRMAAFNTSLVIDGAWGRWHSTFFNFQAYRLSLVGKGWRRERVSCCLSPSVFPEAWLLSKGLQSYWKISVSVSYHLTPDKIFTSAVLSGLLGVSIQKCF